MDIYILTKFITLCCFVSELWVLNLKKEKKEKKMNKTPYHSSIHL